MGTLQGQFGRKREQAHNYGNKEQKIQSTYQFRFPLSLSSGAWGCVKTSLGTFTSLLLAKLCSDILIGELPYSVQQPFLLMLPLLNLI